MILLSGVDERREQALLQASEVRGQSRVLAGDEGRAGARYGTGREGLSREGGLLGSPGQDCARLCGDIGWLLVGCETAFVPPVVSFGLVGTHQPGGVDGPCPLDATVATVLGVMTVLWITFAPKLLDIPVFLHINLAIVFGTVVLVLSGFSLRLIGRVW